MTQEEMNERMDLLKNAIQINGNIGQLVMGDGVYYAAQPEAAAAGNRQDGYFDSGRFRDGIARVGEFIKHKKATWSLVYYFLRGHGLGEMTKSEFGNFVSDHGGPTAKTVYGGANSGNFNMNSGELLKNRTAINAIAAFFPGIDSK